MVRRTTAAGWYGRECRVSRRVDPTDLQAERAVLGGVLVDPAQWVEAARRL
jgi:hypothetical protein